MKIVIGSDHAGYEYKVKFIEYLKENDYEVIDIGCNNTDSVDYPIYGFEVGKKVIENDCFGIAICGSGIGISIAANKIKGVRAVNAYTIKQAKLSRQHNNCNVICFGSRLVNFEKCIKMFETFIKTRFKKGRHIKRVSMLDKGESNNER